MILYCYGINSKFDNSLDSLKYDSLQVNKTLNLPCQA